MRTTLVQRGIEFGKLAKYRAIVFYRLSPYEQKAFDSKIFTHGVPNLIRRTRESFLRVVPPFVGLYFVIEYANAQHERVQRKKPGDFENDV